MDFYERQPAPKAIVYVFIVGITFQAAVILGMSWLFHISSDGQEPFEILPAAGSALVFSVVMVAMWQTTLKIWIDDIGIRLRMPPFHLFSERTIRWSEIESVTIRKVSPFGEFGGWGYRWDLGKKTGYVWNGKQGIEVKLTNGKSVVITVLDLQGARTALEGRVPVLLKDISR
ncbi:MAG: hypothetical protein FGM32_00345 [Candidatus Kapabacteria bacterium]|nr:hypothetical protein [Candidatus Kapabacteria bacterium]